MKRRALLACALLWAASATNPAVAATPLASKGVTVEGAWSRATPPGTPVGVVYLVLKGGPRAAALVGGSTPVAARVEAHESVMDGSMMSMQRRESVPVPARGKVVFAPTGLHLMLLELKAPLVAGKKFPLTLRFADGGHRTVTVEVRALSGG